MLISCLMPTYGRYVNEQRNHIHIVEEAIESFLRQTDQDAELIIINDQESVILDYSHPRVRIYNFAERFPTLGDKRNALVGLSRGDLCVLWDDDDISLPHRISNVREYFEEHPDVHYAGAHRSGFCQDNRNFEVQFVHGPGRYASGAFRRRAVMQCPYRSTSTGEDAHLCADLVVGGYKVQYYLSTPADFIYRWGMGIWHISPNSKVDYDLMGQQQFEHKTIELKPHWQHDYERLLLEAEERLLADNQTC